MSAPVERIALELGIELVRRGVYRDERGSFSELWNTQEFKKVDLDFPIAQTGLAHSKAGVIRGLHFQHPYQQKLITVVSGRTFTVAVDVRGESATFGKFVSAELSADSPDSLLIPAGFAHGFLALEDTVLCYHCDQVHEPNSEWSVLWNDPDISIPWPLTTEPILSPRDRTATPLEELKHLSPL